MVTVVVPYGLIVLQKQREWGSNIVAVTFFCILQSRLMHGALQQNGHCFLLLDTEYATQAGSMFELIFADCKTPYPSLHITGRHIYTCKEISHIGVENSRRPGCDVFPHYLSS